MSNFNIFTSSQNNLKQYLYIYLILIYKLLQNSYSRPSNKINFSQQTHSINSSHHNMYNLTVSVITPNIIKVIKQFRKRTPVQHSYIYKFIQK
ncbi:hypothetical protein VIGAN_09082100 [Vigna angularis var. angularis]|uniref:Uncharacterized protein n=1 Tax=Vigna angularis var. angularis TaxID=157739 RepID=A0A0S3SX28_PHAAN|nr:hypothetical protein VIGAN_09082100 [Vigna angularis var. angularis]